MVLYIIYTNIKYKPTCTEVLFLFQGARSFDDFPDSVIFVWYTRNMVKLSFVFPMIWLMGWFFDMITYNNNN